MELVKVLGTKCMIELKLMIQWSGMLKWFIEAFLLKEVCFEIMNCLEFSACFYQEICSKIVFKARAGYLFLDPFYKKKRPVQILIFITMSYGRYF